MTDGNRLLSRLGPCNVFIAKMISEESLHTIIGGVDENERSRGAGQAVAMKTEGHGEEIKRPAIQCARCTPRCRSG